MIQAINYPTFAPMHHRRSFTSFLLIVAFILRFTAVFASSGSSYTPSACGQVKQQREHSSCVWLETNEELEEDDSEQDDALDQVEIHSWIQHTPYCTCESNRHAKANRSLLNRDTYLVCRSLRL